MKAVLSFALALSLLASTAAHAADADIRKGVSELMGSEGGVASITKTPYGGLYEVMLKNGEMVYSDEKGTFVVAGQIIDVKRKANYTAERSRILNKINFAELPLDSAVKLVRGNGKRVFATFEDPNCGYCKKFVKELQGMKDVTIYTFLYPILAADSVEKSKAIWCAEDRAKAWTDWMVDGKIAKSEDCKNPVEQVSALGRKLRISGTPTIFLADGSRIGGAVSMAELERLMNPAVAESKAVIEPKAEAKPKAATKPKTESKR